MSHRKNMLYDAINATVYKIIIVVFLLVLLVVVLLLLNYYYYHISIIILQLDIMTPQNIIIR